ncbi:MAG: exodeoxyribonuclease VII small subunit [Bacteroidales bacterium]|nr:exodeoxyribonuclease VII small subunit [Bacteroidales bacterium]
MKNEETYDSAMTELTTIIRDLEDESISVDVLAGKVKRANELIRFCRERLLKTEEEVQELLRN